MNSPGARQRRRRQQYQAPRSRREVMTAVGAGVGIVLATALVIWLLRPGGLADRQPRMTWFVCLIGAGIGIWYWGNHRPKRRKSRNQQYVMGGSAGVFIVVFVAIGVLWPGGLLRHTPTYPAIPTTPTSQVPATGIPTPTVPGGSTNTAPAGATTTAAPAGTTTAP
jgi:hypothetical protein